MQIIDQGIVYPSHFGTDRQSCAFPGVCVSTTGRWLVSFRAAPEKSGLSGQHPLLCWSDDRGATWSEPIRPFEPPQFDKLTPGSFRAAYLTALKDGTLIAALCWVDDRDPSRSFFNEETEGLLDTRICLSRSKDDGLTWSSPTFVSSEFDHLPTPLTGPILQFRDAEDCSLLAIQLELNKPYFDKTPWHHRSILLLSDNDGHTWSNHIVTSDDPALRIFYWDQRPALVGDKELLNLFWTFDRETGEYLNIHARKTETSYDDWSTFWDTGVPGQPAAPVRLSDGQLVMVYVDRTETPTIKLRTSKDGGHHWPVESEIILYSQGASQNLMRPGDMLAAWEEMSNFAVGLPATALLPDNELLVIFYAGQSTNETSIHWQCIRASTSNVM